MNRLSPAVGAALSTMHTDPANLPPEPCGFLLLPKGEARIAFNVQRRKLCERNGWPWREECCVGCGRIFNAECTLRRRCPECRRKR